MTVRGTTQPISVTYYATPGGSVVDATGVTLSIYRDNVLVVGPLVEPTIVREALGRYRYDWPIPVDAVPGFYVAAWSGLLPGATDPSVGYETLTVEATPTPTGYPFGATRAGVTGLVPEARLMPGDTIVAGKFGVTEAQVDRWIDELSASVALRLDGWERLTNVAVIGEDGFTVVLEGDRDRLVSSARTIIHNGAASYLEAARHPERAAVNDTSYAAVLWDRYTTGLAALEGWLTVRLDRLEEGDAPDPATVGGPDFGFPAPLIGDALRF